MTRIPSDFAHRETGFRTDESVPAYPGAGLLEGISLFRTEMDGHSYRMVSWCPAKTEALGNIKELGFPRGNDHVLSQGHDPWPRRGFSWARNTWRALPLALVFPAREPSIAEWVGSFTPRFSRYQGMDGSGGIDRGGLRPSSPVVHEENLQKTRVAATGHILPGKCHGPIFHLPGDPPCGHGRTQFGRVNRLVHGRCLFPDGFRIVNKRAICMERPAAEP